MNFQDLALQANAMRQTTLKAIHHAGSGHPGGSLGMADVLTALYFQLLQHDPKNPQWQKRDRLVLSNGHICPILYCALAYAGYFPVDEMMSLRKFGARLQGHPHRGALPGLETTSGPLGSGLSQGCGMALAARLRGDRHHVVVLTSDGEHQEGNTWEAVMLAAKYNLDNVIQIMDRNEIQIDGRTEEVMPLDDLREKYEAFHWRVIEINAHHFDEIIAAYEEAARLSGAPTLILAKTIPGKGVSFMENNFQWHGKAPDDSQLSQALAELGEQRHAIEQGTFEYAKI